jgi:hypothetical protein
MRKEDKEKRWMKRFSIQSCVSRARFAVFKGKAEQPSKAARPLTISHLVALAKLCEWDAAVLTA